MKANWQSLGTIFDMNIRLVAPLFQRPYVWSREENWEPLWEAIRDTALRRTNGDSTRPNFLGAIVLEQLMIPTGEVESRLVIDGQQRLTTLQISLAAMRDVSLATGSRDYHEAFKRLTENYVPSKKTSESIHKVWPTNRDRQHFQKVMTAGSLTTLRELYGAKPKAQDLGELIPNAYVFFYQCVLEWLGNGEGNALEQRLQFLYKTMRQDLFFVVIDIDEKGDAQGIFETLNALGTPLLPADLIKNFLFRRAEGEGQDMGQLYEQYWRSFDDDYSYWREKIRQGRLQRPRVDIFMQHYLTLKKQDDVGAMRLFASFKDYVDNGVPRKADEHICMLRDYATVYHNFDLFPKDTREGLFFYRLDQLDTQTVKPVLLEVFKEPRAQEDIYQILTDLESYLVRRAVCNLTYSAYNRLFVELIKKLSETGFLASEVRSFLLRRTGESARWPTDDELRTALLDQPLYRSVKRAYLRVVLEGIERAFQRGDKKTEPIEIKGKLTIEHIMPQAWETHWPLTENGDKDAEETRNIKIQTFGNLTLVTGKLNPALSNASWPDKKEGLLAHSALAMNRELQSFQVWDENKIDKRGNKMLEMTKAIWPRPNL